MIICAYSSSHTTFTNWEQACKLPFRPTGPERTEDTQDNLNEQLDTIIPWHLKSNGNCFVVQHEGHKFSLPGQPPVNKSSEPVKLDKGLAFTFCLSAFDWLYFLILLLVASFDSHVCW